jgi:hypothetical protein
MSANFLPFPDAEAVVGAGIRAADTALAKRVYSTVPKKPTYPLARVQRIGGLPAVRRYMDAANVQVNVWAGTKSAARDAAEEARRAIMEMEGTTVHEGDDAFVAAVEDALGLTYTPDDETGKDGYTFAVRVMLRSVSPAE